MDANICGQMPEQDALIKWLLDTPSKVIFTSIMLKRLMAPEITELPITLNITYMIYPSIFDVSMNHPCNVQGLVM